jgi:hypothetical protein
MNMLQTMPGLPIVLIVFAAALATVGLAFVLPDLTGWKPKTHGSKRVRPAVGAYVLLAEPNVYLDRWFGVIPGSIGIIVDYSSRGHNGTGVLVHWLTKPDDLVHQDFAALEAAGIYAVFHELGELAFCEPRPTVRTKY